MSKTVYHNYICNKLTIAVSESLSKSKPNCGLAKHCGKRRGNSKIKLKIWIFMVETIFVLKIFLLYKI